VGPISDESLQPPCHEIIAPPEVVILAPPEVLGKETIISDDNFRVTEVLNNSDTPKQTSLAPPNTSEIFSQNIEKLTSVKGRIGKRLFCCKNVNDSKKPEWLLENQLAKQLVHKLFVMEDPKRVLRASLLQRACDLRP